MVDEDEPTEQVLALIGKHASRLARLAREQGCTTLVLRVQDAPKYLGAWRRLLDRPPSCGSSLSLSDLGWGHLGGQLISILSAQRKPRTVEMRGC